MKGFNLFSLTIIFYLNTIRGQKIDCSTQANGFKFDSNKGCSFYNLCAFSSEIEKECPYALHFDSFTNTCKNPKDIIYGKCSEKEMCLNKDGEKFPHVDCEKFYLCYQDKPILKECSNTLHYDYKKKICTLPANIDGPCNKKGSNNICANEKDGKSLPHSDEKKFYFCVDGDSIVMECGKGLTFDKDREFCVAHGLPRNFKFPCNRDPYDF